MKGIILVLMVFFMFPFYALSAPKEPPTKPHIVRAVYNRIIGCQDIEPQFQNIQFKEFIIPAGTAWSQCLMFKNHTDEVGLLFERDIIDEYNQTYIDIIPPPYFRVETTNKYEEDNYSTIKVKPEPKRRAIINLSEEAGAEPDAPIAARLSLSEAKFDRKVIIFYELTESGTTLASITVTKIKNPLDNNIESQKSSPNIKEYENYQNVVSINTSEPNSIAQESSINNIYAEDRVISFSPENKFSTAQYMLPCMYTMTPPNNINSTGRSLNRILSDVELHRGSFYVNKPSQQKILDKFLAVDDNNSQAHASAIAATAYIAVQRYGNDRKAYSFALGAAEQLSPSGPIAMSMLETLIGDIDNVEYNKGASYTRNVYLKDNNRRSVKDSCSRIPESKDDSEDYPFCTTPFREYHFSKLFLNFTTYEAYPFNYGENIDLTFDIDTFTMADDVWVIATGGVKAKAHRVYSREKLYGFDSFTLSNYSTKDSGALYINVRSREYNEKMRSDVHVKIYCKPRINSYK